MSATAYRTKEDERNRLARYAAAQAIQSSTSGTLNFHGVTVVGGGGTGGIDWQGVAVGAVATNTSTITMTTMVYANAPIEEHEYFKPQAASRLLLLEAGGFDNDAPEGEDEFMEWLNKD